MARSHGKILASAWNDPDWTSLLPREQWMYWTLLGQPKLTLVGVMDYMPARWAQGAGGCSVDYIESCVSDLEAKGFVVVDRTTGEILVRTFVRHDGIEGSNINIRKGMWGAWSAVASPVLRKVAVDNVPKSLWTIPDFQVPAEAVEMSRSEPWERPLEQALERPSERAPEPLDLDLHPSPEPAAAVRPDARRQLLEDAAAVIGQRAAQRPGVNNPAAMARSVAAGVISDRFHDAYAHIHTHPGITPNELADWLEPPPEPSHVDLMSQAQQAIADRHRSRLAGTACDECQGNGVVIGDDDLARPCKCKRALRLA